MLNLNIETLCGKKKKKKNLHWLPGSLNNDHQLFHKPGEIGVDHFSGVIGDLGKKFWDTLSGHSNLEVFEGNVLSGLFFFFQEKMVRGRLNSLREERTKNLESGGGGSIRNGDTQNKNEANVKDSDFSFTLETNTRREGGSLLKKKNDKQENRS